MRKKGTYHTSDLLSVGRLSVKVMPLQEFRKFPESIRAGRLIIPHEYATVGRLEAGLKILRNKTNKFMNKFAPRPSFCHEHDHDDDDVDFRFCRGPLNSKNATLIYWLWVWSGRNQQGQKPLAMGRAPHCASWMNNKRVWPLWTMRLRAGLDWRMFKNKFRLWCSLIS